MLILILYFQKQVQKRNRITRRECLDLAEDCHPHQAFQCLLWREQTLKIDILAANSLKAVGQETGILFRDLRSVRAV